MWTSNRLRRERAPRRVLALWPLIAAAAVCLALPSPRAQAQALVPDPPPAASTEPARQAISARTERETDGEISDRISSIFSEVAGLRDVRVRVASGVVTLTGTVSTSQDSESAEAIAARVSGVVTVQNHIERDLKVDSNLKPVLGQFGDDVRGLIRALPLMGVALAIAVLVGAFGHALASFTWLWRKAAPNAFLAELFTSLIRLVFIVLGIVAGLEVLGATALLGAVLGGAGVIGIAIGFAVRDTVDNYVSSVMLSLRQPFRANDHVVIEGHEGRVVRLTSRATILMTLDGNHLRIPNATVFKAVILNYTRNPERRFEFELGIGADNDPVDGMAVGLKAVSDLQFVLSAPEPTAVICEVGDSNIVLRFFGWIDQSHTDFFKGRSLALDAAKRALEDAGFALPEPIYRLRFDHAPSLPAEGLPTDPPPTRDRKTPIPAAAEKAAEDPRADSHIARMVDEERANDQAGDLLDSSRPIE